MVKREKPRGVRYNSQMRKDVTDFTFRKDVAIR